MGSFSAGGLCDTGLLHATVLQLQQCETLNFAIKRLFAQVLFETGASANVHHI
jgi:hypothetical protein